MSRVKNRKIQLLLIMLVMLPLMVQAQFKSEVPDIPGLNTRSVSSSPSILGLDLSRINFQHSYSMSVSSMGGDAVAMGLLKTSFDYAINPQVSFRGSVGLLHSPFSSMGPAGEQIGIGNEFNLDNIMYSGEVTYKPKENMTFQFGISKLPMTSYSRYGSPYPFRYLGY